MSVAGKNVDIELSDPVIGVELAQDGSAVLYIDEGQNSTDVSLSYHEVCELLAQFKEVRAKMEWNAATHVYTRNYSKQAYHLLVKDNQTRTLCNRLPSRALWDRDPVVGEPSDECCKVCLRVYHSKKR